MPGWPVSLTGEGGGVLQPSCPNQFVPPPPLPSKPVCPPWRHSRPPPYSSSMDPPSSRSWQGQECQEPGRRWQDRCWSHGTCGQTERGKGYSGDMARAGTHSETQFKVRAGLAWPAGPAPCSIACLREPFRGAGHGVSLAICPWEAVQVERGGAEGCQPRGSSWVPVCTELPMDNPSQEGHSQRLAPHT